MDYILHVVIIILIYVILVQSLNLIMGYVGAISMGHAVFSAIGAYTATLLSIHFGYNFILGTALGFLLAFVIGALLAIPSLRVRDEYLIVFTVGFQMVVYEFMLTARRITQGQGGITGIPSPSMFGVEFQSPSSYLLLVFLTTLFCFALAWRLTHSPFGRVLKAIREDEGACRALGKNTLRFKVLVFALGGGIAAIGGSTLAFYITFISPFSFNMEASIALIVMVILGGAGNFWGPLVGASVLVGLPEILRFLPGSAGLIDALREVFYGLILMFLMIFRPQGILPEYSRRKSWERLPEAVSEKTNIQEIVEGRHPTSSNQQDSPASTPYLVVKEVSKSFGGLQAVSKASIALPHGETIGLIGPNGCGKTTLFNMITGFLESDEGVIYFQGKDITRLPPYERALGGIVRSWQDVRVFKGMTVLDNVMVAHLNQAGEKLMTLFLSPSKVSREEQENYRKAWKYINLVGLGDRAEQLATDIPAADQILLALARLLATECPVFLLDEPTASLDLQSVERVVKLIRDIAKQEKKTVLLIEHNLDVVRGLVEKVYFMNEGKILAYGEPSELMRDPQLAAAYFGID